MGPRPPRRISHQLTTPLTGASAQNFWVRFRVFGGIGSPARHISKIRPTARSKEEIIMIESSYDTRQLVELKSCHETATNNETASHVFSDPGQPRREE
eukprot:scaffold3763_cov165-Amphora_coffeaeformis.AAC.9